MNKERIETLARSLQIESWKHQKKLLGQSPSNPIQVLDPELAAEAIGYRLVYQDSLGSFGSDRYETAGVVNKQKQLICISSKFKPEVMRFTAGHELGHVMLHDFSTMHRDRPIAGPGFANGCRELLEQEADYFSACFFMPTKLLNTKFQEKFGQKIPFVVDDRTAFLLRPNDPDSLLTNDWERYTALASAKSFQSNRFISLASEFKVSVQAMALRLKELGLVRGL